MPSCADPYSVVSTGPLTSPASWSSKLGRLPSRAYRQPGQTARPDSKLVRQPGQTARPDSQTVSKTARPDSQDRQSVRQPGQPGQTARPDRLTLLVARLAILARQTNVISSQTSQTA